jgi:hypothetical protein
MDINETILNCDTKSHADSIRIATFLEKLASMGLSPEDCAVIAGMSDGQSMIAYAQHRPP